VVFFLKFQSNLGLKILLSDVIFDVLKIQIGLSLLKFIIMGPAESIVGSIGSQGGALATSLPVLAFMFLWLIKKGRIESKDWWTILGFMFIGFVSLKRALWFIMPIVVALFMFYIPKRRIPNTVIFFSVLAVPLIFYLGVRFNPTLNKEGAIGGSFDAIYAFDYAKNYMFGDREERKPGTGRGGATLLLYDKILTSELSSKDWFGYGLRFIYATNYEEFEDLNFGISTKGAATGLFQTYVSSGFIGILTTVLFTLSILFKTRNRRLKYVLILFFFWEYFLYTGIVLREYSLSFLLIYLIIFSEKDLISRESPDEKQNRVYNNLLLTRFR
jgi:hypothetical protein